MGNPFDQFDDKSQNPFDKFDAKPSFSDYAIDAARTIPGGLAQGVTGIVGLPSSAVNFANNLGGKIIGKNWVSDEDPRAKKFMGLPTTGQANQAIGALTGGYYQPKYTPGEYAQTVSEFVPSMFGGEASLVKKGINTVGSALGSEWLGRKAKGTVLETPLRIAGALIGHGAASKAQKIAETGSLTDLGAAEKNTLSSKDLLGSANNLYEDVKKAPAYIGSGLVNVFKTNIQPVIDRIKLNPEQHAEVAQIVNRINNLSPNATVADLHAIRTNANFIRSAPSGTPIPAPTSLDPDNIRHLGIVSKTDKSAIGSVTDILDKFVQDLKNPSLANDVVAETADKMTKANQLYAQGSQGAALEKLIVDARKRGFTNLDQNLRQKFQTLYENSNKLSGFPQEVQDAIKTVATGDGVSWRNGIHVLSRLVPSSIKSAGVAGIAEMASGIAGHPFLPVVAATVIGAPAKIAANFQTANAARIASLLAKGGKPPATTPFLTGRKAINTVLANQGAANQPRPDYENFK